jgi:glycosyltransferase involved in cell wall biosynthesis/peptidoglycan/xylan/chitin deacetylase (PgdA/CDA1 family)
MISQHPYASHQTQPPFWGHPCVSRNVAELLSHGVEIDLVCTTPRFCFGHRPSARRGLRVYGIPMKERREPALWYPIQYAVFFLWALFVVSGLALRRGYDVVQVDNIPDFLVFSALVPRLRRMPVVFFVFELMPELTAARMHLSSDDVRVRLVCWLERRATGWADRVITVSDRLRRIMAARGLDAGRVTVVPNSHPLGDLPTPNPPRAPVLILPTTLIERYGAQVAIRAVAELRHDWPDLTLQILGDGEYRSTLVALTEELGLQKHVTFSPGFVPWRQAVEQVRQATLGIVPIISDGYGDLMLPNKVCELVFMEIPFACSRLSGIEEHLPSDAVAYFEPGDVSGLAAQIRRLLSNPEQARQQAKRAKRAMADLAWENASRRYLAALGVAPGAGRVPSTGSLQGDTEGSSAIPEGPTGAVVEGRRAAMIPDGGTGDRVAMRLFSANTPAAFWRLLGDPPPTADEWAAAVRAAAAHLPEAARAGGDDIDALLFSTLGEGQFGPDHWRLSSALQLYYASRPFLPRWLTLMLRRSRRRAARSRAAFGWPIEDGYVRFLWSAMEHLLQLTGQTSIPFIHFWPEGRRYALVLTHDIETAIGQARVRELADIDASYGFRSSFNFVAEQYPLDLDLIAELRHNGFEVGIHGLKHDGQLFRSRRTFLSQAEHINRHVAALGVAGFRAPCTHRNPAWMQELDIEYDLSYFDTDPYEPIPGGTMSLWPFEIGRFVELPYTLVQDYTLTSVLNEGSPRLWLEKVDFIQRYCGMALVNTHPDYLPDRRTRQVYVAFLESMSSRGDYWSALPQAVARWWRARQAAQSLASLPGAVENVVSRHEVTAAPPAGLRLAG